ncbi:discoidin domain-containing protein [Streptacidiphilus fuscans]|uniref:Discoidin domain-containing protein n=1 Tax=Streptacidiphilus fuscans TaxID=2789292 RepID=A0A931FCX6_9ACTN|nr:discoidin domain-containing protein [Streptacidiphilus fuscans]MBF9066951.1 discoidin domain-containing protein [Streptacidiphilus fuscans]
MPFRSSSQPAPRPIAPAERRRARSLSVVAAAASVAAAVTLTLTVSGGPVAAASTAVPGDIACGAATTATTTATGSSPSNATDCDTGTAWQSTPATLQELMVDLGSTQAVDHVTIVWGSGYGTSFKIRTSPDGTTWHTQTAVTAGTGGTETVALPAGVSTRWIEIYGEHYAGSAGFSVDEFEVFGTAGTPTTSASPSASASASASPSSSASASPTSTSTGGATGFSQAQIDAAVAEPLIAFAAPTSSVPRPGTNPTQIGQAAALQYLALVDKEDPGAAATSGTTVDSALLAQVRNLIAGGHEPDADGGLEGWSHALVAQALLLVKNGPAWSELTATEQNKVALVEQAMGYAGNYAYNDASNFSSGICGYGNFAKTNNPNYEDGYVSVEAAAIQFFGASTWTQMLASFDDSTFASQLNAAGLTNAGGCFTTVGSAANTAIQPPFVWKGHTATDLMGIWNQEAADTFDQTVTSSVTGTSNGASVTAHINDGTTSPEQGKLGMGHEFDSTDSGGLRSSALYVFEGWMNVTGTRLAMSALGNFSCTGATSAAQYQVGSQDLMYKLHHGYISYAASQSGVLVDDAGDPSSDGPNTKGYQLDLDAYNTLIATQGC